jgi:hypothetical protein
MSCHGIQAVSAWESERAARASAAPLGAETRPRRWSTARLGPPEPFSGDHQRRKLELWPNWTPDPQLTPPTLTSIRSRLNTYTGYSVGCAVVWAALLATGRRLLDTKSWDMLRLSAAGWWGGWLSATIARVGYPPPPRLTEEGQRRLEKVSLVLVLLGFINFFRLLITGRRGASGSS